jgi:hypothetical protein
MSPEASVIAPSVSSAVAMVLGEQRIMSGLHALEPDALLAQPVNDLPPARSSAAAAFANAN